MAGWTKARSGKTAVRGDGTLWTLVDGFAGRGDAPAVLSMRDGHPVALSFSALAGAVDRLAGGLIACGVRPGEPVAVVGPPGPDWLTAAFAILRARAVLLPVDAGLEAAEQAAMLADAGCARVFVASSLAARLAAATADTDATLYLLGEGDAAGDRTAGQPVPWRDLFADAGSHHSATPRPDPADRAALFYTSGTTGRPKGVPLTHGQIAANIAPLVGLGVVGPGDRVALPLPLHHVYPLVVGALTPLAAGAAVLLPGGLSGVEIAAALRAGGATVLIGVPRLYGALLEAIGRRAGTGATAILAALARLPPVPARRIGGVLFGAVRRRLAPRLRLMVSGGAKLDAKPWRRLEALGWTVLTGYGLTETAPILTFNPPTAARIGTEGAALPGIRLRIDAAPGAAFGEVQAKGASVFAGYLNRPDETDAAFTADGWFRTGDLGRLDRRGYLTIIGRSKELIVLPGGENIFPDTVEAEYARCPLVREIAVLERNGALVGLAVPDMEALRAQGTERAEGLIRERLEAIARTLPSYRRLAGLALSRRPLPRTPVGKLRRHLLPPLYDRARRHAEPAEAAEPSGADRAVLDSDPGRRLWDWLGQRFPETTLSLDTSPQLDLGIDSLGWISLAIELQDRFGIALGDARIARILTLRDLLREAAEAAAAGRETAPAQPVPHLVERGMALRAAAALVFAFGRCTFRLLFRLRVDGAAQVPLAGPVVIAPNHASWLDPVAVATSLPRLRLRALSFAGWTGLLYRGPLSRLFSRVVGVLPVDPDRAAAASLALARAALARGDALVWFPEGERTRTGALLPFRPGIGTLLRETGAPVVPVWIEGTFAAAPVGRHVPRLGKVRVRLGAPLGAEALAARGKGDDDAVRIADGLRAAVAALGRKTTEG
jgi:long-chain acyl-CoA synthetase